MNRLSLYCEIYTTNECVCEQKHAKLKIMFNRLQIMCYTDIHKTLYVHQIVLHNLTCKMRCHRNKETCPHVEKAACHTTLLREADAGHIV